MKKLYTIIWGVSFALMVLVGCVGVESKKTAEYETVDMLDTQPSINQAVLAAEVAKTGDLKTLPFVNVDDNSKIVVDKMSHFEDNGANSLLIKTYNMSPEGIATLDYYNDSQDIYGRIDRRIIKVVYEEQKPNASQADSIKSWLLKQKKALFLKTDDAFQKDLVNFQKANGLKPDGKFGPKTAKALVQDIPMINVQSLENHIVYPEIPNHVLFLLPYDLAKKEKERFKRFGSWLDAGRLGISKEEFKKASTNGDKFVLFIYFFDRVNPDFGISIGLSTRPKQRGVVSDSEPYHTKPGDWPFITKVFSLDSQTLPDKLYVNIFLEKSVVSRPCIGSHKLL